MKVMLLPDLHCYPSTYMRGSSEETNSRLQEWLKCAYTLRDEVVSRGIQLVLAPGDFFMHPRPTARQVLSVSRFLGSLSEEAEVVGCMGNHDLPGAGQTGPADLLLNSVDGRHSWVLKEPTAFTPFGGDVAVCALPYVRPSSLEIDESDPAARAEAVSRGLLAIAQGLAANKAVQSCRYKVLMGHWTILGSKTSSGHLLYGTEPTLNMGDLHAQGWDAILFGHIHKPQALNRFPFTAYSGSLLRENWTEEEDSCGAWVYDLKTREVDWVSVPARRLWTLRLDGDEEVQSWEEHDLSPAEGAIVRVAARHGPETTLDQRALLAKIEQHDPFLITGIQVDIERADRQREATVTEETGPLEALDKWMALKKIAKERQEKVRQLANGIMVAEEGRA